MLSLGACVVGNPEQTFYAEFKPVPRSGVPAALEVTGISLEEAEIRGEEPKSIMERFAAWVKEVAVDAKPVMVGFNASFDWAFINYYFHHYVGTNPLGHGAIDMKAYYMGFSGCCWDMTRSSQLPSEFQPSSRATHHALEDAIAQGSIFEKLVKANTSK